MLWNNNWKFVSERMHVDFNREEILTERDEFRERIRKFQDSFITR